MIGFLTIFKMTYLWWKMCFLTILQSSKKYQIINFPEDKNQHIGTWKVRFCFETGDAELGNQYLGGDNSNILYFQHPI